MGTEVLRPQDCLMERIRLSPPVYHHHQHQHHRRNMYANANRNPNPNSNPRVIARKPAVRREQKKRFENNGRSASLDDLRKTRTNHHNHHVMGHVTILRRGESLDSQITDGNRSYHLPEKKAGDDLVLKQIRIGEFKSPVKFPGDRSDVFAGSAVPMSPSPRSLPLPSFFGNKRVSKVVVDDWATRDLRRLLRLD